MGSLRYSALADHQTRKGCRSCDRKPVRRLRSCLREPAADCLPQIAWRVGLLGAEHWSVRSPYLIR